MAYSISCTTTPNPVRKKCITQITPCPQALITNTSTPDKFLHRYLPGKGVYRVPPQCEVAAGEAGSEVTVLQYSSEQQLGVIWDGVVFTRDPSLPGFLYVATITATPNSQVPNSSGIIALTIGNIVTSIGEFAFDTTNITSIVIPASVTEIGAIAFIDCLLLASVTFAPGSTLGVIRSSAFRNCNLLQTIVIPASVTEIGNSAFRSCDILATVTFAPGSTLTTIGVSAFEDTALTSIVIPNSVTSIESETFASCDLLTTITIPALVTSIASDAFFACTSLATVYIPATNGLSITSPSPGPVTFYGRPGVIILEPV